MPKIASLDHKLYLRLQRDIDRLKTRQHTLVKKKHTSLKLSDGDRVKWRGKEWMVVHYGNPHMSLIRPSKFPDAPDVFANCYLDEILSVERV